MKDSMDINKDMKSKAKHAMESMQPEMEEEDDEKEESVKKSMGPEAKLEIEIMLQAAKKKKK